MKPSELHPDAFRCNDEVEAWLAMKSGDKGALSFFYTRYFNTLYNYGSRIAKDNALTEDCIQDLFTELWCKHEGLSDVRNIKYYLFKCLRHKILYKLSLESRLHVKGEPGSFQIELSHKTHYLSDQINTDTRKKITELIKILTPKQREAIFLIYYEELSYEEVALIMDLKIKTIYNLIHLAISKLRENKSVLSLPLLSVFF
jgi:RNA polymerase sigma factor (sigma-70 family)